MLFLKPMNVPSKADSSVTLTAGLIRNTVFNTAGLAWSVLLVFASTPYIVRGLTIEGYGLFGIIALVAGYAGLFSAPTAAGSVRFMAQAYARRDWSVFREAAVAGVVLSTGLALFGTIIIFMAAPPLTRLFDVANEMSAQTIAAFRLAAFGFFFGTIASTLESIPAASRRYDMLNGVKIGISTLRIVGILYAIWLGNGLIGAVAAQLFANITAVVALLWVARSYLRRMSADNIAHNTTHDSIAHDSILYEGHRVTDQSALSSTRERGGWHLHSLWNAVRQLFSFSLALFFQQTIARFNQQIDRTVIGLFLGASTLTFYTVPLQISDRIPMLMTSLTTALYPLSSEALGNENLVELQQLYLRAVRLLIWLSAFLATLVVAGAQDLLLLWVGPEFATRSWFVLTMLAIAAVWRTPSTVAYQVYNGLGRADMGIRLALLYCFVLTAAILLLTSRWGINGTATAILVATVPVALYADILTQRTLLAQTDWALSLLPYLRPWLVGSVLVLGLSTVPEMGSWWNLIMQGTTISCGFWAGLFLLDRESLGILWMRLCKLNLF